MSSDTSSSSPPLDADAPRYEYALFVLRNETNSRKALAIYQGPEVLVVYLDDEVQSAWPDFMRPPEGGVPTLIKRSHDPTRRLFKRGTNCLLQLQKFRDASLFVEQQRREQEDRAMNQPANDQPDHEEEEEKETLKAAPDQCDLNSCGRDKSCASMSMSAGPLTATMASETPSIAAPVPDVVREESPIDERYNIVESTQHIEEVQDDDHPAPPEDLIAISDAPQQGLELEFIVAAPATTVQEDLLEDVVSPSVPQAIADSAVAVAAAVIDELEAGTEAVPDPPVALLPEAEEPIAVVVAAPRRGLRGGKRGQVSVAATRTTRKGRKSVAVQNEDALIISSDLAVIGDDE